MKKDNKLHRIKTIGIGLLSALSLCVVVSGASAFEKADAAPIEYNVSVSQKVIERSGSFKAVSSDNLFIVSRDLPDPSAKSVNFEITFNSYEKLGSRNPWLYIGAVNGTLKTNEDKQFKYDTASLNNGALNLPNTLNDYGFCRWLTGGSGGIFASGMKHSYTFDFENNFYTVDAVGENGKSFNTSGVQNAKGETYTLPAQTERKFENPSLQHYGMMISIVDSASDSFKSAFTVKCWDSTGKDLGFTFKTVKNEVYVDLTESGASSILSRFSDDDCFVYDNFSNVIQGTSQKVDSAIFGNSVSVISAEDTGLTALGAADSVIKYALPSSNNGSFAVAVRFGNSLKKEDVNKNKNLTLRAWLNAEKSTETRISVLPLDNSVLDLGEDAAFIDIVNTQGTGIAQNIRNADRFTDVLFSSDDLNVLINDKDELNGFIILVTRLSADNKDAYLYLDKLTYSEKVRVCFVDDGENILANYGINTGSTLSENGYDVPQSSGLGWTTSKNGTQFFGKDSIVDSSLILYVKNGEQGNYADVVGTYANAENGKYFTLKEDKTIAGLSTDKYVYAKDGSIILSDGTVYTKNGDGISMSGTIYKKIATTYKVSFYSDEKTIKEVIVPKGFACKSVSAPTKKNYVFSGWMNNGSVYDFTSAVQSDIKLEANYSFIHISDYSPYIKGYFDDNSKILYCLKKDGVVEIYEGGIKRETTYLISAENDLLIEGKTYSINEYEIAGNNSKFRFLRDDYKVVLDMSGEGEKQTYTVTKEDNYLLPDISNPSSKGYVFKGWRTADGRDFDVKAPVTGNVTVYAVWDYVQGDNGSGCNSTVSGFAPAIVVFFCTSVAVILFKKRGLTKDATSKEK